MARREFGPLPRFAWLGILAAVASVASHPVSAQETLTAPPVLENLSSDPRYEKGV